MMSTGRSPNTTLTCVELVPEANLQGHALFRALLQDNDKADMQPLAAQNNGRVEFLTANAMDISPDLLAQQDVVYVAAMVNQPSKQQVLRQVANHMKPGARMLCRSGNGLRQVMYEHVPDEWFLGTRGEVDIRAQSSHTMVGQVVVTIKAEAD